MKRGSRKRGRNRSNSRLHSTTRAKMWNRSGQVWIETVIYTLIAFVMIGLVLAFARPEIEKMQDKAIIQQSTEMIREIDSTILDMAGAGNKRLLDITIKKGVLKLDCVNDKIIFEVESKALYSEPGKNISDGDIIVLTKKGTEYNLVTLTRDYHSKYNLKFKGEDVIKEISKASNPYRLSILNEGGDANDKTILNMSID